MVNKDCKDSIRLLFVASEEEKSIKIYRQSIKREKNLETEGKVNNLNAHHCQCKFVDLMRIKNRSRNLICNAKILRRLQKLLK